MDYCITVASVESGQVKWLKKVEAELNSTYCKEDIGWISFIYDTTQLLKARQRSQPGTPHCPRAGQWGSASNLSPKLTSLPEPPDSAQLLQKAGRCVLQTLLLPCCSQRPAKPVLNPFQNPICACGALAPSATWLRFHMRVWHVCGDGRAAICTLCYWSPQDFAPPVKEKRGCIFWIPPFYLSSPVHSTRSSCTLQEEGAEVLHLTHHLIMWKQIMKTVEPTQPWEGAPETPPISASMHHSQPRTHPNPAQPLP